MPKPKAMKRKASSSDPNSGPDDRGPATKKPAPSKKAKSGNEEPSWDLGNRRLVKINEFKGKAYIDIREYYEKDGKLLPSKKIGIPLTAQNYQKLKEVLSEVDEKLAER